MIDNGIDHPPDSVEYPELGLTRRQVLQNVLAGAALAFAPVLQACGKMTRSVSVAGSADATLVQSTSDFRWDNLHLNHEVYAAVLADTLPTIDRLYEEMRGRGDFERTEAEEAWRRNFLIDQQYELLEPVFSEALGANYQSNMWREALKVHEEWTQKQIEGGLFIRMEEDNPQLPYFAQQVGMGSGETGNNPDMLWMRKEFLVIMGTLVSLVNYQIDLFNKSPLAYGGVNLDGSLIPHISAIKISGAFRTLAHHAGLGSMAAKTRPSVHVIGHGLDIAALRPEEVDFEVVRFVEPFLVRGVEQLPAGAKLKAAGFGEQTRIVLSRMIGRALMCMETPLENHQNIFLRALWENVPRNWHLTMRPPEHRELVSSPL